ncbi:MAG: hypothetical protein ABSG68_18665, partial [Thermoguttaceae bacterium]
SIVEWWRRLNEIYATGYEYPRWYDSLADLEPQRLRRLAAEFHADYALAHIEPTDSPLPLPIVERNESYIIYCLR